MPSIVHSCYQPKSCKGSQKGGNLTEQTTEALVEPAVIIFILYQFLSSCCISLCLFLLEKGSGGVSQSCREDNTNPLVERAGCMYLCLCLSLSYQDTQVQECGDLTEVTTLTEWAAFAFAFVFAFVFLFQN